MDKKRRELLKKFSIMGAGLFTVNACPAPPPMSCKEQIIFDIDRINDTKIDFNLGINLTNTSFSKSDNLKEYYNILDNNNQIVDFTVQTSEESSWRDTIVFNKIKPINGFIFGEKYTLKRIKKITCARNDKYEVEDFLRNFVDITFELPHYSLLFKEDGTINLNNSNNNVVISTNISRHILDVGENKKIDFELFHDGTLDDSSKINVDDYNKDNLTVSINDRSLNIKGLKKSVNELKLNVIKDNQIVSSFKLTIVIY